MPRGVDWLGWGKGHCLRTPAVLLQSLVPDAPTFKAPLQRERVAGFTTAPHNGEVNKGTRRASAERGAGRNLPALGIWAQWT